MQKHIKFVVVAVLAFLAISACTPNEIAIWNSLSPNQQGGVLQSIRDRNHSSTDCYGEMRRHFPAHAHAAMSNIITRESGGNAGAKNPSSSASGCFQMMASIHRGRLPAGGSFFNAHDNTIAALSLWQSQGLSPWRFSL